MDDYIDVDSHIFPIEKSFECWSGNVFVSHQGTQLMLTGQRKTVPRSAISVFAFDVPTMRKSAIPTLGVSRTLSGVKVIRVNRGWSNKV